MAAEMERRALHERRMDPRRSERAAGPSSTARPEENAVRGEKPRATQEGSPGPENREQPGTSEKAEKEVKE